ncbi:hypothetical protein G6F62_015908 [Rhizopus arrhizus]|nr:hypothetical protein G6F35_016096 [Rhizopus arrhizus]KAG1302127.1 hypothetical protein G6F62_015908 [Rhizopus arrhizus]KAG1364634.1 hypothetical protein G6F59_018954 [Rhizopus arrhizus]
MPGGAQAGLSMQQRRANTIPSIFSAAFLHQEATGSSCGGQCKISVQAGMGLPPACRWGAAPLIVGP